ncbi:phage portal protein [Mycobacterium avium]|uniref:phage portal protein n=1 Tax=Mycobacterium avium TaxID=1764 RepID=UPI0009FF3916|nr:phage portal protein [Mycobacterium avium]
MSTQTELLTALLQRLNEPLARYADLDRYYEGKQPLAFLSPEAKTALGNRFGVMSSNIPRLAVTALAERLRVTGFTGQADVWAEWVRNDLDQTSGVAHREALLLGDSYVIVWADQLGRPRVTVESAKQVAVLTDPGSRQIVAAVKRWEDTQAKATEAVVYLPDEIRRLRADQQGAVANGFRTLEVIPNPLGVVPVVRLSNTDRIVGDFGSSEIDDLKPLVDALNKSLADMMVTSEYVGRPRRWATGIELTEEPVTALDPVTGLVVPVLDDDGQPVMTEVNPIPEGHRAMISENEQAQFGQLNAADLSGYEASVRVILGQIMAVSTLPAHYVGVFTDNPASADALRAAEASLTARAEARQATFGRAWEQVARLMIAVRDGRDPNAVEDVRVQWADAATRSVAQEADAVVKLHQAGLLPVSYALKKLGYSDDEIAEVRVARRAEALDGAGLDLVRRNTA